MSRFHWLSIVGYLLWSCLGAPPIMAEELRWGKIEGRILSPNSTGIPGVTVTILGTDSQHSDLSTVTNHDGVFRFQRIAPRTLELQFTLGDLQMQESLRVEAGATVRVERTLDWPTVWTDSILVTAASRRVERVVDSPSAATVLSRSEVERQATQGQVPRLLAATPGVEMVQSGLYDINFNSRGFNTSGTRRVLTLVDGQDPSHPLLSGAQEWAAVSLLSEEISTVELVRGPNAALYGTGAFNGVLNLVTLDARSSQGGQIRLAAGELNAVRLTGRYAGQLGENWFYKTTGGFETSRSFSQSRVGEAEYGNGSSLLEVIPLPKDRIRLESVGLRLERTSLGSGVATLATGSDWIEGTTMVTTAGRLQRQGVERPWVRLAYDTSRWHVQANYSSRFAEDAALAAGTSVFFDQQRARLEFQRSQGFQRGRGHLLGGLTLGQVRGDTANPDGVETAMDGPRQSEFGALFGQIDYQMADRLKGVLSLRLDKSDIHKTRISPRAALVYQVSDRHTLRLSAGDGFQNPTLIELGLRIAVAPPLNLSSQEIEIPRLAVGNPSLEPEEITSVELGYTGTFGRHFLLTVDVFQGNIKNFVTPLLPFTGTSLGRLHGEFAPYAPPPGIPGPVASEILEALERELSPEDFANLVTDANGNPFVAVLSITNFGEVQTRGAEIAASYNYHQWRVHLAYSLFDFETREELSESPLIPNTPKYSLGATVAYVGERFDASLTSRWVPDFQWRSGPYDGPVNQYSVTDLMVRVPLGQRWKVGLEVTNLFDDEHYELYGGDLLARRAMAFAQISWQ